MLYAPDFSDTNRRKMNDNNDSDSVRKSIDLSIIEKFVYCLIFISLC